VAHPYGPYQGTAASSNTAWDSWNSSTASSTTNGNTWSTWVTEDITFRSDEASEAPQGTWHTWVAHYETSSSSTDGNAWTHWVRVDGGDYQPAQRENAYTLKLGNAKDIPVMIGARHEQLALALMGHLPEKVVGNMHHYNREEVTEDLKAFRDVWNERQRIRREKKAAEAKARAEELLVSLLDEEQEEEWKLSRTVTVKVSDVKSVRIKEGWAGNCEELDENGHVIARHCIHPSTSVPNADNMISQLLMLETDPDEFFRISNRSVVR